jgi:hypothetical protein
VSASASKTDVTVGEPFTLEVTATGPEGTVWTFPAEAGDERVELRTPASPAPAAPAATHRYEATAFALGEVQVPAVEVRYRLADGGAGAVSTSPIPLRILSILPRDPKEQKLVDIRGPVTLAVGRAFWIASGALLLLAATVAVALVRRRRAGLAPPPSAPAIAPDAAALAAIERLAASGLLRRGEYRAFYIELAEIAKRYLEARLQAPVLEMTSSEAVAFLRGHGQGAELATPFRDLATAADRIKFARGAGLVDEGERHLAAARAMVATLEEKLRPRPAPGQPMVA